MGTIVYKCKRRPKYSGVFSFGNSKLPYTTAMFNMTSATDCPSRALGLCQIDKFSDKKHRCYALRTERMFPKTCLVYKRKQAKFWDKSSGVDFIKTLRATPYFVKITTLRFNESGDFRKQADIVKAENIAGFLYRHFVIKAYCYTARKDLDFSKVKYLTVMGSGFTAPGIKGEFKAVKNVSDKPKGFGVCCGDCVVCHRCIDGKNTVVVLH